MKKILLLSSFFFLLSSLALASPSPVVQVVAYQEPLGMYFSLQGWGSGSVIDSSGHILTNNHVVDDGLGGISRDFAICVTEDPALPPRCDYTASVVARDPDRDIALLLIDPVDIFGHPVDYTVFQILTPDYTYQPTAGDAVIARGYPWVGASTITQTQGVVSGTSPYNGNTYIKTDTLIAGGNSGGPLLRDGKIIGINTFLIGGSSDPALGYSLLISEAKNFLQKNINSTETLQKNSSGFAAFLKKTTNSSQSQTVTDPLISFHFPKKYLVTTHIPGAYIDGQIAQESTTDISAFSFLHLATPVLKTPEDIRYFLTGQSFFPFWGEVKFTTTQISGQSWYSVDALGNTTGDKAKTQYLYFTVVDHTHLLLLLLTTPPSNENTYDTLKKNIADFLSGITLPTKFSFEKNAVLDISDADLSLHTSDDLIDYRANFFPYDGIISQLMSSYENIFTLRSYLGNLWSYAQLTIVPNAFYTEGTSVSELLRRLRESEYFSSNMDSQIVSYHGYDGFVACNKDTTATVQDEKGSYHETTLCETVLLVGEDNSHFLSLIFSVDSSKKPDMYRLMKKYLDSMVVFTGVPKDGKTQFSRVEKTLPYTDVDDQSLEFRETLRLLVDYGVLTKKSSFDGDHPLTWSEYVRLHIWTIYHKRLTDHIIPDDMMSPTFESILRDISIDGDAFVDSTQVTDFDLVLRMRLAGVSLSEYSAHSLRLFQTLSTTRYRDDWKKIEDFEYRYFTGKKIPLNAGSVSVGYYSADLLWYFNPLEGLLSEPIYPLDSLFFGRTLSPENRENLDEAIACNMSSVQYFSPACLKNHRAYLASFFNYAVLTKGNALSYLIGNMDFALWDSELAQRKLVTVEK